MHVATASTLDRNRPAARLTGLLIALVVVAVMWTGREIPGFDYAMLMDDDTNILFNAHLGVLDGPRLWWMLTDMSYIARYQPLGWLSFNWAATSSDLSPLACHVAGVAFHAMNAVVVFLCLRRLIRRFSPATSPEEEALGAGLGALLWALHPLRVETVAWCSALLYVEGGLFALLAVYARLRELEARSTGTGKPRAWFGFGAAMFALSLLTYPVALFLSGAIVVLDCAWWIKADTSLRARLRRVLAWEAVVLVMMSGLALAATLVARHVHITNGLPLPTLAEFGVVPRLFQAGYVWASYLWRTLWPIDLTPGVEALFEIHASDVRIWAAFPVLLVISACAWRWRRSAPFVGACWISYLVWMVPVLGLTEHPHVAADRYSYIVSVLFSVGVVFGLLRVRSASVRGGLFVSLALMAAFWAGLSVRQARLWADTMTLHRHVITRLRDVDLRNITLIRMAKLQFLAGDVRGGREAAEKIYAAAPQIAGVARTWREMTPAFPLPPEIAKRSLQEWPAAPWACLHERIAIDQLREGRLDDALVRLNAALALDANFEQARFSRALLLAQLNQPRAAAHDWLVLEARDSSRTIAAGGMRFAADRIITSFRAAGNESLAAALQRRAAVERVPKASGTTPSVQ